MPSTPASLRSTSPCLEVLRLHPAAHDAHAVAEAAVAERLVEALVGVLERDVFADDADDDLAARVLDGVDQLLPGRHVRARAFEAEGLEDDAVQALAGEDERDLVDGVDVLGRDDRLLGHVAVEGELRLEVGGEEAVGAAEQDVGLDADGAQLAHAVLHGLGLELVGGRDVGHEGEVDEDRVAAPDVLAELAHRLQEGQRLDVADGAADLHDHDVRFVPDGADRRT